ncbi:hypothetical protein JCM10296v2_007601 [Rhodotorula toruloides]
MSRLSLAQTLPPELLSRIFGWLTESIAPSIYGAMVDYDTFRWTLTSTIPDLGYAALVCRRWRSPAQRLLFRAVRPNPANAVRLKDSYVNRPDLAEATQAAEFELWNRAEGTWENLDEECELALSTLMLCPNLRHMTFGFVTRNARDALVALLDHAPLESLVLLERGWPDSSVHELAHLSPFDFCSIAAKPSLRYFQLQLRPRLLSYASPCQPLPTLTSHVTTLSLTVNVYTGLARLDRPAHHFPVIIANLKLIDYEWSGSDMSGIVDAFREVLVKHSPRLGQRPIRLSMFPNEEEEAGEVALSAFAQTCRSLGVDVRIDREDLFDFPEKICIFFFCDASPAAGPGPNSMAFRANLAPTAREDDMYRLPDVPAHFQTAPVSASGVPVDPSLAKGSTGAKAGVAQSPLRKRRRKSPAQPAKRKKRVEASSEAVEESDGEGDDEAGSSPAASERARSVSLAASATKGKGRSGGASSAAKNALKIKLPKGVEVPPIPTLFQGRANLGKLLDSVKQVVVAGGHEARVFEGEGEDVMTEEELDELERAMDPALAKELLTDLAHQRETLDQAYAAFNDELFKAQIEESVLNNVQALLVEQRELMRKAQTG